jgi:hypothetical protein
MQKMANHYVPYRRQDRAYDIRRVRSYSCPRAVAGRSGLYIMFCAEEETHSLVMVVPGAIIFPVGWAVQSLFWVNPGTFKHKVLMM